MKRIIASTYITSSASFPVKSGSWDFLQDEAKEVIASTIIGMIGSSYSTSKIYRLYGAELTNFSGDNWLNSAGAVFYNGEVYQVDAVGGSGTSMPDGIDMGIDTSYFTAATADPVTYTDGTPHNVHQIKKIKYVNNASPVYGEPVNWNVNKLTSEFNYTASTKVLSFENNKFLELRPSAGACTVTFDTTNAVVGAKYTILFWTFSGSGSLTLTAGSGQFVNRAGQLSAMTAARNVIEILYCGNDGTNDVFLAYNTTQN